MSEKEEEDSWINLYVRENGHNLAIYRESKNGLREMTFCTSIFFYLIFLQQLVK